MSFLHSETNTFRMRGVALPDLRSVKSKRFRGSSIVGLHETWTNTGKFLSICSLVKNSHIKFMRNLQYWATTFSSTIGHDSYSTSNQTVTSASGTQVLPLGTEVCPLKRYTNETLVCYFPSKASTTELDILLNIMSKIRHSALGAWSPHSSCRRPPYSSSTKRVWEWRYLWNLHMLRF